MHLKLCLLRAVFWLSAGDRSGYAVEYGLPKSPWSFRALESREILLWPIDCSSVRGRGNRRVLCLWGTLGTILMLTGLAKGIQGLALT